MFHAGLALWLMLQPPAAAATAAGAPGAAALPAMTSVPGDMGRVRTAMAAAVAGAAAAGGSSGQAAQQQRLLPLPGGPALEAWQRRHAALQCSTAELLGDGGSYRNWLSMLSNLLAKQQRLVRAARMRGGLMPEACTAFLTRGPPADTLPPPLVAVGAHTHTHARARPRASCASCPRTC
jgi:hypothetical protein